MHQVRRNEEKREDYLTLFLFIFSGEYGTQGAGTSSTTPGGRRDANAWNGPGGMLWLFGGTGYANNTTSGYFRFLYFFETKMEHRIPQ